MYNSLGDFTFCSASVSPPYCTVPHEEEQTQQAPAQVPVSCGWTERPFSFAVRAGQPFGESLSDRLLSMNRLENCQVVLKGHLCKK